MLEKLDVTKVTGSDKEGQFVEQIKVTLVYTVDRNETYELALERINSLIAGRFTRQFQREGERLQSRADEVRRWYQMGLFSPNLGESRDDNPLD